jgi:predicted phosphodiesterase
MILAPDLHLRASVPRCRTETEAEWFAVQKETLDFLYSFSEPVAFVGDIFHHWSPGWKMVELFLSYALKHKTYIMMGNHDARNGMLDPDSGYGILDRICKEGHPFLKDIGGEFAYVPFGETEVQGISLDASFLFIHRLVVQSNSDDFPAKDSITARKLLSTYPNYRNIITGDNHAHFAFEKDGRYVLNAGSMTKQSILYKDVPRMCFRVTPPTFEELELPDKGELIDDAYIVLEHERENKYTQLVETLKTEGEVSFDFKSNVYDALAESNLSAKAIEMVKELLPV